MIPHFSNPHLLHQFTKIIPRSEIYADDGEDTDTAPIHDPDLFHQLNQLLERTLQQPTSQSRSRKRRKIETDVPESTPDVHGEPMLFRLVSSTLPPIPVSLLPPPLPPPVTREPDAEDSEQQAHIRKHRAEVASVDGEAILRESKSAKPSQTSGKISKHLHLRASLYDPQPSIMIVRKLKQNHKTCLPAPHSNLAHFPYFRDISPKSVEPVKSRTLDCPVIDAEDMEADPSATRKRRKRKKGNVQTKERPLPQFWRPNPAWRGKCMGYAYGFPSNLASGEGFERWKYSGDGMRKAVYPDPYRNS